MWIVRLDCTSECYHTNWTKVFKKEKNAKSLYRKHIIEEFIKWSDMKPTESCDTEYLLESVLSLIESNEDLEDYTFEIHMEKLQTGD